MTAGGRRWCVWRLPIYLLPCLSIRSSPRSREEPNNWGPNWHPFQGLLPFEALMRRSVETWARAVAAFDPGLGLAHLGATLAGGHLAGLDMSCQCQQALCPCAGRIVGPGGPVLHRQRDEHPLITASDLDHQVVGGSPQPSGSCSRWACSTLRLSTARRLQASTATATPSNAARGWPRLRISLCRTDSRRWKTPSIRQRRRYRSAICRASIIAGRLLHSQRTDSPDSVGVSSCSSIRRHDCSPSSITMACSRVRPVAVRPPSCQSSSRTMGGCLAC